MEAILLNQSPRLVLKRFGAPSTTQSVAKDSRVADSEDSDSQGVHYGTPWRQGLSSLPQNERQHMRGH